MKNPIRDIIQDSLQQKADVRDFFYGVIGDGVTVEVPNRPGYIYVTLNDGAVTEVLNTIAPNLMNFPVVVGYDPAQPSKNVLCVVGNRTIPVPSTTVGNNYYVRGHHVSHEWMNIDGGQDIVYIQTRQIMPLRPTPLGNWYLYINPDLQLINNQWQRVGGQIFNTVNRSIQSFTSGSAGDERFVLVSLDMISGSINFTNGTIKAKGTMTMADVPALPSNNSPICALRFWTGQADIIEAISQTDLADLRMAKTSSISMYPIAKQSIDTGQTLTIPAGYCYVVGPDFTVNGTLIATGDLILVG
jgi:hypothetical protein